MILKTNRLNMREIELMDINSVHQLHSLQETDEFNTLGIPETIQTTEKIVNEWLTAQKQELVTLYVFCIELIDTAEFIGLFGLDLGKQRYRIAEVWCQIHKNYWKQGYASEALAKILDFSFNKLKLQRIEAGCAIENIRSIKVLEKAGMTREGRKRKILPIRGQWKDNYIYSILETEFEEQSK